MLVWMGVCVSEGNASRTAADTAAGLLQARIRLERDKLHWAIGSKSVIALLKN